MAHNLRGFRKAFQIIFFDFDVFMPGTHTIDTQMYTIMVAYYYRALIKAVALLSRSGADHTYWMAVCAPSYYFIHHLLSTWQIR